MRKNSLKIPFTPSSTPEAIAAALDWLASSDTVKRIHPYRGGVGYYNVATFAWFDKTGKKTGDYYNLACHASLSSGVSYIERDVVALWTRCDENAIDEKFHDYFRNRSFCSDFILDSNENGVVVSVDIPPGLMHAIATVSRLPRMVPEDHFKWFNNLVDAGIPEDVAFNVAMNCSSNDYTGAWYSNSDHRVWGCPGIAGLNTQLTGDLKVPSPDNGIYRNTASNLCDRFMQPKGDLISDLFKDKEIKEAVMESRRTSSGEAYRPPNPFVKQVSGLRHGEMSIKELHEIALPLATKKGLFDA
jgi:hypothetical protein